ncbi:MAG: tyrosine-type recombinase/integrase [Bacilli bacterium]|nr:tyrosine-type recombinase/integrase [Bacilli bacterium]
MFLYNIQLKNLTNQLTYEILPYCQNINLSDLQTKNTNVLSSYKIQPLQPLGVHSDIWNKIELFLSAKKLEGLSRLTLESYRLELRIFSEQIQKMVEEVTTADIRLFLGEFTELKTSSISKKLSVLKSFFSWLTSEEIIQRDPTRKIKPPKKEKRMPKALTIEEFEMMRESCQTRRERAILEVLYSTGGRLSEIQALDRKNIDWQNMSTRVIGKGDKERNVFLSYKATYHLKKYLMCRLDQEPALFVTERQPIKRLSNRSIQRVMDKIAGRIGLKESVSPHVMRHTLATHLLNNGADISLVQAILGHENPATTQIYAQLTDDYKKERYRRYFAQ